MPAQCARCGSSPCDCGNPERERMLVQLKSAGFGFHRGVLTSWPKWADRLAQDAKGAGMKPANLKEIAAWAAGAAK